MLKFFHKYQNSVIIVFFMLLVTLGMIGFGVDFGGGGSRQTAAITIDDTEISFSDYNRERRQLQNTYQQRFGNDYYRIMKQLGINLGEQTVDKVVAEHLLYREAKRQELFSGDGALKKTITSALGGVFNRQSYQAVLRQNGLSSTEFEDRVRRANVQDQFLGILRDASFASEREAKTALELDFREYEVSYVEITAEDFLGKVEEPSPEKLETFFLDNATDYETAATISYDYIVFEPKDFYNDVELSDEDIEFHYSENINKYMTPERLRARHIQFNFPAEEDPEAMASVKISAEEAASRLASGEDFAALVLEYSDDLITKTLGGEIGWLTRGSQEKAFEDAAFALGEPGVTDVIATDYGFHIVEVLEFEEKAAKELDKIREEIRLELQKRDAPAYAAEKANAIYDTWIGGEAEIKTIADSNQLKLASVNDLVQQSDPSPTLKGLTAKVISFPDEDRTTVDIGDKTVLISVREYKEPKVPALESIKETVLSNYKKVESERLATEAADTIHEELTAQEKPDIAAIAQAKGLELKTVEKVTRTSDKVAPVNDPAITKSLFNTGKAPSILQSVFSINQSKIVMEVSKITEGKLENPETKLAEYKQREAGALGGTLITSLINMLKAESEIDFDAGLYSQDNAV